jgi:hypothetical protein
MVIENFSTLSQEELKQFAEELLDKINAESIFSSETDFEFDNTAWWGAKDANGARITGAFQTDDMTGDLDIALVTANDVSASVKATWQASEDDPYDFDYASEDYPDFDEVFVKEAIIDGYKVTLEVNDYDFVETEDVEVDDYTAEDSGIGHYEYWGHRGYDSHPYLEVEGTLTNIYKVYLSLNVAPVTNK